MSIIQGWVDGEARPRDVELVEGSNSLIGKVAATMQPFAAIVEAGLTELIGADEQVDQNDLCGSVAITLGGTYSGEILGALLVSRETGTGAVQTPDGILFFFDADPSISSGDTAMSAAARQKLIGQIAVTGTDFDSDANGASVYLVSVPVAFHALAALYVAFRLTSATSYNDAAGDDEILEVNLWLRRDS